MENPYHPRAALSDPSWFFGRTKEIAKIFSYLNKSHPQNVSLVGQRRIGKSWLLQKISQDKSLQAKYLQQADKFTFVYWNLQSEVNLSPDIFFTRLVDLIIQYIPNELRNECRTALKASEVSDAILQILELLEADDHRVILLLDEFATITHNKSFAETFFSHLRSLFDRPGLTCVTASYRSLGEMCHLGPDSPFFNIFSSIYLNLFSTEEAEGFVEQPMKSQGFSIEPDATKAILRLSGSYPCFISQICHSLFHECQDKCLITKEDVDGQNGSFQASVFDDYSYYFQRLNDAEQMMLRDIAEGNSPSTLENPVYLSLERLSLVRRDKGKAIPFSIPFGQHIKDTKGTDVYFEKAFSNPELEGPNFVRLCEVVLAAVTAIPESMRTDLADAIQLMQNRPKDAMAKCGRDVLDPLFNLVYQKINGGRWDGKQYETCQLFEDRAQDGRFPKHLAAHFHSVRIYGNHGSHPLTFKEACTPARAFLSVIETIHLAEEVYKRYGK